ncbi:MAG: flagellar motor switch protein FliN [Planctomycetota bacterium]
MGDTTNNDGNPDEGGQLSGFSQDEIDALFGGSQGDDAAPQDGSAPDGSAQDAAASSTPPSDGAGPLDGSTGQPAANPEKADNESGLPFSQSDIDNMLNDGSAEETPGGAEPPAEDPRLDTLGRPFDDTAAAMKAAIDAEAADKAASPATSPPAATVSAQTFDLPEILGGGTSTAADNRVTMLGDVKLRVRIQLGKTRMLVEDVLALGEGSVVELDKLAGDPVDVIVNDRLVARGEVLVLNDTFCVRISEVLSNDPHRISQ